MPIDLENGEFLTVVKDLIGEDTVIEVVKELNKKEEITDEELANKFNIRLNDIRKVLYKLYENNLASFRRLRDKSTGWYIFFWKLEPNNLSNLIRNKNKLVLQVLKTRLEYEKTHIFYRCPNDCGACTFEDAMEIGFKCIKCGNALSNSPNQNIILILEEKIELLMNSLKNAE
ncbi:MAG: transcription factor [Promethearchaeota archaeon]|nr:MAG: transcription factor [Candidatus Lokiarchaeota archaeon]